MKRVCDFAVSDISYALLRRIAVLRTYMRPVRPLLPTELRGLSVAMSVCHTSEPCKNGLSD